MANYRRARGVKLLPVFPTGESIVDEWVHAAPTLAATDLMSSLRASRLKRRASSTIFVDLDRAATSLEWIVSSSSPSHTYT